jgi:hypothetical protein
MQHIQFGEDEDVPDLCLDPVFKAVMYPGNSPFTQVKQKRRLIMFRGSWRMKKQRLPRRVPLCFFPATPPCLFWAPFLLPRNTEYCCQKRGKIW